jgi:hypothetical protein
MKEYEGVGVEIHVFLISALVGGKWSTSFPGHFTPGERAPDTNWVGGWMGPRTGLDDLFIWIGRTYYSGPSGFQKICQLYFRESVVLMGRLNVVSNACCPY